MNTRIFAIMSSGEGATENLTIDREPLPMPNTDAGKAIASRNATTHGLFARDVVLPSLGEDPDGYRQLEGAWTTQLVPHNLLEQHYVEKIAAASWRLRRLHRWQAQLLEDDTLTEVDRLDRLTTVMRHETALHRQIDTAVKLLGKDVPQLYARRLREQVLEETRVSERECHDNAEDAHYVELEIQNRLYRLRKATAEAAQTLSTAPLDTEVPASPEAESAAPEAVADDTHEICQNEPEFIAPTPPPTALDPLLAGEGADDTENCQNERRRLLSNTKRVIEYLDPDAKYRLSPEPHRVTQAKNRRFRRS